MRKKALVTGGTRGIGAAIAKALAMSDYEVFVSGRSLSEKASVGCQYLSCDFAKLETTETFAKEIAQLELSVLINNAGINKVGPLTDYALSDFERIHQVNVTAPFLLCRAVVPGMRQRQFGRIVNITSAFSVVSKSGRSAYAASKFGLVGLSKTLALEVAKDNILVNCVAPGFVDTELTRGMLGEKGITEMMARIPIGRMAKPEEIAQAVYFLVSEDNSYITGQNILVDGGFTSE